MVSREPFRIRERILGFAQTRADEQLQFVMELAHQNSYSWNKAGTDAVAALVLQRLEGVFAHHRVVRQTRVGDLQVLTNHPGERCIYLLAHMDTVFPPDHPFSRCRIEGNRLHGPGTGDMKAGVATAVYGALALKEAGVLDRIPLTLVCTGDEEVGAVSSREVLQEEVKRALACLVVEGAGKEGEVVVSRNGKIGARLDCFGRDAHVGAPVLEKASAILELAYKTISLESLNGGLPGVRLNVGKVEGGLGPATIPGSATAQLDIRWEDQAVRDSLMAEVHGAVAREELPGCRSELTILNERPAWGHNEGSQALADLVKRAGKEIGQVFGQEHRRGTSDSNFFGAAGVPTLDGLGPVCGGYHTPEEWVSIPSIRNRTALLAWTLVRVAEALGEGWALGRRTQSSRPDPPEGAGGEP